MFPPDLDLAENLPVLALLATRTVYEPVLELLAPPTFPAAM